MHPVDETLRRNSALASISKVPELRCALDPNKINAYNRFFERYAKDKVIVDMGTGPGVLAWLANYHGASKVYAIDADDRVKAHTEPFLSSYSNIEVIQADLIHATLPAADYYVHEIIGSVLFEENIGAILINLYKQGIDLKTVIPHRYAFVKAKWDNRMQLNPYTPLYIKELYDVPVQHFFDEYIDKVEDFRDKQMCSMGVYDQEPVIHSKTTLQEIETVSLPASEWTRIDDSTLIDIYNRDIHPNDVVSTSTTYGWEMYLDDDIVVTNLPRNLNNWSEAERMIARPIVNRKTISISKAKNPFTEEDRWLFSM